ncbi:MAG: gluconate 2-dehydrogenase subunit 3 family protein [Ferruginibacter sp.]
MNRREAIYNFVVLTTGIMVLPSCGPNDNASGAIPLKNISLTAAEEKLVTQLSDLIIPKTDFIGATDIKAAEFTLMMVDDCYPPEKQKAFKEGLQQFDKMAKDKYGKSFINCTDAQKKEFLTAMESKKDIPENAGQFYGATRGLTIQAFTSSQQYLMGVAKYKMVPGSNFKGCAPVKKT